MKGQTRAVIPLLTAAAFEAQVKDCARFGHMVLILDHVKIDRVGRRFTRPMILRTLRKGQVVGNPTWDAEYCNWVGKMRRIGTGVDMTVVCALKNGVLTVTVVTVYGRPER
jgi:hypothetical protein